MDRREELSDFIKKHREVRKQNKRNYLIENDIVIKNDFLINLNTLISEQIQRQKKMSTGKIKFVYLCRILSSDYTGSYEVLIGMSNHMLYLDENRSQVFWYSEILHSSLNEDLMEAEKILRKNYLRLEDYELFYIKCQLLNDNWDILLEYYRTLAEQCVTQIKNSKLQLSEDLCFLCGNYMDNLKIVWYTEREEMDG